MGWTGLVPERDKSIAVVNGAMNLWVSLNAGKLSSGYTIGGRSSSAKLHRFSELVTYYISGGE
jgi:hypothetical protein